MRPSVLLLALLTCACSSTAIREYLDNETAATITIAAQGWVFARERTDLAVNARDYITLTPIQVNRGGQRTIHLYCQLWSTIDRRRDKAIVPAKTSLALLADDRRLALPESATDIRRLGFGHAPVKPESAGVEIRIAGIDIELLRFIASASEVRIAMTTNDLTEYFLPWRDGRQSAMNFIRYIDAAQR